jgi:hypothetical protein
MESKSCSVEIIMTQGKDYAIRGGAAGRERLRILSRVMHASITSLFDRVGINEGQLCLDVACGGGDGTLELARRIGPRHLWAAICPLTALPSSTRIPILTPNSESTIAPSRRKSWREGSEGARQVAITRKARRMASWERVML